MASLDALQWRPLTELWGVERFPSIKLVKGLHLLDDAPVGLGQVVVQVVGGLVGLGQVGGSGRWDGNGWEVMVGGW